MFRRAILDYLDNIIELINKRMKWMDEMHLSQWNDNGYFEVFPLAYWKENIKSFYVYETKGQIISSICLYTEDDLWDDGIECFYCHHFVSDPCYKGAGRKLLEEVFHLSKELGYDRIRLDSTRFDENLTRYYESLGFKPVKEFNSGPYHGCTREKIL